MTTYAYKDGILAVDSLSTVCGMVNNTNINKLRKVELDDGTNVIVTGSGELIFIDALLKWLCDDNEAYPLMSESHTGVDVYFRDTDGVITNCTYFSDTPHPQYNMNFTKGSGEGDVVASTVLHLGGTAIEAVQVASELCTKTGGDWVYYYDFHNDILDRVENKREVN